MSEEPEGTLEDRATAALAALTAAAPTAEEVIAGAPLPEWVTEPWLPRLTDPSDPKFAESVVKAEEWLAGR